MNVLVFIVVYVASGGGRESLFGVLWVCAAVYMSWKNVASVFCLGCDARPRSGKGWCEELLCSTCNSCWACKVWWTSAGERVRE